MAISMNTIEKFNAFVMYDPAATTPIIGADPDHSVVVRAPHLIHVDAIAAGTSAVIQAKIVNEAEWGSVDVPGSVGTDLTLDDSNTPITVDMSMVNFAQIVRTGVGNFKAYAQGI